MGISTDGEVCYGWLLGEVEFDEEDTPLGDFEEWWYFTHHPFSMKSPFDGMSVADVDFESPEVRDYYQGRDAHKKGCPAPPIVLVNACSHDYPVYIAAIPGTVLTARRG